MSDPRKAVRFALIVFACALVLQLLVYAGYYALISKSSGATVTVWVQNFYAPVIGQFISYLDARGTDQRKIIGYAIVYGPLIGVVLYSLALLLVSFIGAFTAFAVRMPKLLEEADGASKPQHVVDNPDSLPQQNPSPGNGSNEPG